MKDRKIGAVLALLMLLGAGSALTACNTVAGASRDAQDLGRNVQADVNAATRPPPPPPPYR